MLLFFQRGKLQKELESSIGEIDVARILYLVRGTNIYFFTRSFPTDCETKMISSLCQQMLKHNKECLMECSQSARTAVSVAKFIASSLGLAASGGSSLTQVSALLRIAELLTDDRSLPASVLVLVCRCLVDRQFFR